jgi:hypothetical protein
MYKVSIQPFDQNLTAPKNIMIPNKNRKTINGALFSGADRYL